MISVRICLCLYSSWKMAATIEKKHKLSSTENPCPKRTYVTAISNSAEVEKNTKTIFKIILKSKFSHKQHAGSRIVTKERKETSEKKEKVQVSKRSSTATGGLMFDGLRDDDTFTAQSKTGTVRYESVY